MQLLKHFYSWYNIQNHERIKLLILLFTCDDVLDVLDFDSLAIP